MQTIKTHTLARNERLRGKVRVDNLFTQGKAFIVYPFRIILMEDEINKGVPVQVLVSVPKKRIKRAVVRNKLKRRMKEAYRIHKAELSDYLLSQKKTWLIGITYVSNDVLPYALIEQKMIEALQKIKAAIQ